MIYIITHHPALLKVLSTWVKYMFMKDSYVVIPFRAAASSEFNFEGQFALCEKYKLLSVQPVCIAGSPDSHEIKKTSFGVFLPIFPTWHNPRGLNCLPIRAL